MTTAPDAAAAAAPTRRYTVIDYLLDRLAELGADRLFGVPGDFTLAFLDHVEAHPTVEWVGTANELGAGYAADGYARMRGIGALCTTFGVGELSAINAVAGAFAEHVPLLHIVGAPSRSAQAAGRALHHSLGDGDFRHFFRMSTEVTVAQAALTPENACSEIDRVLLEVRESRLPGYLLIATDVGESDARLPAAPLPSSLDLTSPTALAAFEAAARALLGGGAASAAASSDAEPSSAAPSSADSSDAASVRSPAGSSTSAPAPARALESGPPTASALAPESVPATASAPAVAVLADLLVQRMGATDALHRLLDAADLPHATLLWGRRVVDESAPNYLGTYAGAASDPAVRSAIEGAGVLVLAGVQFTDLTSGFFSHHLDVTRTVRLDPHRAAVAGEEFDHVDLADALDVLAGILKPDAAGADPAPALPSAAPAAPAAPAALAPVPATGAPAEGLLGQSTLWDEVAAALRPGDLVLADQGTSFYGMGSHRLPHDVVFIGQPLWASIGYTLPALLGAALAAPERRPVLLIGDGAAQLTAVELGTMVREGLAPIVVVVNNDGYTVERAIHGPGERYNDIAPWDWTALPAALARGAADHLFTARATTAADLRAALAAARSNVGGLSLIEAVVPPLDVPPLLSAIAAAAARANAPAPAAVADARTAAPASLADAPAPSLAPVPPAA